MRLKKVNSNANQINDLRPPTPLLVLRTVGYCTENV
jgi:hypothetical protein